MLISQKPKRERPKYVMVVMLTIMRRIVRMMWI